jgi:tight adherence protein C
MGDVLTPEHLMGVRLGALAPGIGLAVLVARVGGAGGIVLALAVFLLFAGAPDLLLVSRAQARRRAIEQALPTLVDLMGLTMAAGMGFENALAIIADAMTGPLKEEIDRYQDALTNLGMTRRDALRAMARRVGSPDLTQFTESVIQAMELGSGLLNVINTQARLLRVSRRRQAEASAKQAPVRMILPMAAFIFPVMMLIILGPAMLRLMGASQGTGP